MFISEEEEVKRLSQAKIMNSLDLFFESLALYILIYIKHSIGHVTNTQT